MSIKEDFLKLMRPDEYDTEAEQKALQEQANADAIAAACKIASNVYGSEKLKYKANIAKAVIAECVARVYMGSLIIENADAYRETLMPTARNMVVSELKNAKTIADLKSMLENASPIVKSMIPLAEEIAENHDDIMESKNGLTLSKIDCYRVMNSANEVIGYIEADNDEDAKKKFEDGDYVKMNNYVKKSECKSCETESDKTPEVENEACKRLNEDATDRASIETNSQVKANSKDAELKAKASNIKPFSNKVILDKDDLQLIHAWEKSAGADVYSEALQDRIAKVYAQEEENAKAQKERVQAIVDKLSEIPEETMEEAATAGLNMISNEPYSLFNAIFINKSKHIMSEAVSDNAIVDTAEDVICETICSYTLLECIHSLGIHTYTDEERTRMMYKFIIS